MRPSRAHGFGSTADRWQYLTGWKMNQITMVMMANNVVLCLPMENGLTFHVMAAYHLYVK